MIELWLPFAPSVNHAYKRGRGGKVFKSPEAVAFFQEVRLKYGWLEPLAGEVSVSIDFYRPRKVGDIDNPTKLTLDSLQGLAYVNDSQITELHIRRLDDKKNHPLGAARVTVATIQPKPRGGLPTRSGDGCSGGRAAGLRLRLAREKIKVRK